MIHWDLHLSFPLRVSIGRIDTCFRGFLSCWEWFPDFTCWRTQLDKIRPCLMENPWPTLWECLSSLLLHTNHNQDKYAKGELVFNLVWRIWSRWGSSFAGGELAENFLCSEMGRAYHVLGEFAQFSWISRERRAGRVHHVLDELARSVTGPTGAASSPNAS